MCRNGRNRIFELRRPAAALAAVCLALAMAGTVTAWVSAGEGVVVIQLYVTENSQPCEQAIHCLEAFVESRKGIALQVADVTQDVDALKRIWQLSKEAGLDAPRAPAMYLLNRLRVGFKDEATMQHIVDELLTMDVYVRSGCSRCRKAKLMLADLQQRWPAIQIRYHDIVYDPGARERFEAAARRYGVMAAATPTFEFAGRLIVGYQNDQLTGAKLEAILRSGSPPQQSARVSYPPNAGLPAVRRLLGQALVGIPYTTAGLGATGFHAPALSRSMAANLATQIRDGQNGVETSELPASELPASETILGAEPPGPTNGTSDVIVLPDDFGDEFSPEPAANSHGPQGITVPWLGELRVRDLGMPAFTFLIGLIDGFNPCAMWVLIFLLSVLVNVRSRKKIVAIAGTFVVISGLAYFAFMAAWLNIFRWMGVQRPIQIALGGLGVFIGTINVKDFFAFHKGVTLSIPAAAKPGIYRRTRDIVQSQYLTAAIAGAVVLAVVVNVVELLCTAGLPALYTQILTMQQLPAWANYCYLALYNVAYMFDDALLLTIIVITMSHRKLQEQEGRWLKLLSGTVVLGLGLVMMVRPEWLS